MNILIEAGTPVGKAQQALHDVLKGDPNVHELSEIARRKEFHGVHFKQIMSAAKALAAKGLINYEGSTVVWKPQVEHRLAPVVENVAKTIMSQIGKQALFMIGAKQFVDHGEGVSFNVGRNSLNANIIHVTYNRGGDDYTIEFKRSRGVDLKTLKTETGLLAGDLTRVIGDTLGLAMKLPTFASKHEGVGETSIYASPVAPPTSDPQSAATNPRPRKIEPHPGPWRVSVDMHSAGDVEVLMAALADDDETDWPMQKTDYGMGIVLTVDAPTRAAAEDIVRSTLVRIGWVEKQDHDPGSAMPDTMPGRAMGEAEITGVKKSKEEAGYAPMTQPDGKRCGECGYVTLPDGCKKIEGKISQDGVCNFWRRGISA